MQNEQNEMAWLHHLLASEYFQTGASKGLRVEAPKGRGKLCLLHTLIKINGIISWHRILFVDDTIMD